MGRHKGGRKYIMPQNFKAKQEQYGPVIGSFTYIFSDSRKKREETSIGGFVGPQGFPAGFAS